MSDVPEDFPVKVLGPDDPAKDRATCGHCGRSWDDAVITSWTPTPSARCPFEYFHDYDTEEETMPEAKKRPYNDKLSTKEQRQMEQMISCAIQAETCEVSDPMEVSDCDHLSKDILLNVLLKFRPDFFDEE